tara:strand:+ start:3481 stop:3837 length:357 start_codon:yes stop_codon:yes gene_type:complete
MKYRSNTRQRKKSIQGLRSFKDTLPRKIREAFLKKGKIYSKITDNWKIIVGSELYNACKPKSFKNIKNSGIKRLNIMVKRGHETEVEYSREIIKDKINSFLGYEFINNIKLINYTENK